MDRYNIFNQDFYPTPHETIETMLNGVTIENKVILEPSAGKGNIIDFLKERNAKNILFCETSPDLATICSQKATFLKADFLEVKSEEISHVNLIVMNPPFTADEKHILHAYQIAPDGCKIISLCNSNTLRNDFSQSRKELKDLVKNYGNSQSLGEVFKTAERKTSVEIDLISIIKPSDSYSTEFEGFFTEEEPESNENGLMSYNVIQDLVGRYIDSVKIYDKQLEQAQKMNDVVSGYFGVKMGMTITQSEKPTSRNEFKKAMQKSGWDFIFKKLNMQKYSTQGLKDDINKFVEQQENIPFTMKNIYKMLETIIGTTSQRMDKAILEMFDRLTKHYNENRYNVEGWKTNSHYMLNEKFILPDMVETDKWHEGNTISTGYGGNFNLMEDLIKAICFLTGDNYDEKISLKDFLENKYKVKKNGKYMGYNSYFRYRRKQEALNLAESNEDYELEETNNVYGVWLDWDFFQIKCFKKGTIHFKFNDRELWGRFNRKVAELKGYPLFEKAYRKPERKKTTKKQPTKKATILGTFKKAV